MEYTIVNITRFWSNVRQTDGCWYWTGWKRSHGYGGFGVNGKDFLAHRVAYELTHGSIPEGMNICHHCDNPLCVRPDHLFAGTQVDNIQDASHKGRMTYKHKPSQGFQKGEANWNKRHPERQPHGSQRAGVKLTEQQVIEIRNCAGLSQPQLARKYGVNQSTINRIILRHIWSHI